MIRVWSDLLLFFLCLCKDRFCASDSGSPKELTSAGFVHFIPLPDCWKLRGCWNVFFINSLSFNEVLFFGLGEKGFSFLPMQGVRHLIASDSEVVILVWKGHIPHCKRIRIWQSYNSKQIRNVKKLSIQLTEHLLLLCTKADWILFLVFWLLRVAIDSDVCKSLKGPVITCVLAWGCKTWEAVWNS